jgi:hypothetical protein
MLVLLEASSPSSLFCLVRVRRRAWWLCWGRLPLLLTLLNAGEEEAMVVVLEASSPSPSLCLAEAVAACAAPWSLRGGALACVSWLYF